MGEVLYYENPYIKEFDAVVVESRTGDEGFELRLDRTAFYPEGGGQPCDLGQLDEVSVLGVRKVDGEIWHEVDAPIEPGSRVHGEIDWIRRFDYMQQHSGQHILSGALSTLGEWATVSVHQGAETLTIEIEGPSFESKDGTAVEDRVNAIICENRPISDRWVDESEIANYDLRRPPQVGGKIRLVEVDGFDLVACGGVHCTRTGEVSLVRYLGSESIRGRARTIWRVGARAHRADRLHAGILDQAGTLLSSPSTGVVESLDRLLAQKTELEYALKGAQRALTERLLEAARAKQEVGPVVVTAEPELVDQDHFVSVVSGMSGLLAGLITEGADRVNWTIAAGEGVDFDFGTRRQDFFKRFGAKGGGRSPAWRGIAETELTAEALRDFLNQN